MIDAFVDGAWEKFEGSDFGIDDLCMISESWGIGYLVTGKMLASVESGEDSWKFEVGCFALEDTQVDVSVI